jgi:hypothetical protein
MNKDPASHEDKSRFIRLVKANRTLASEGARQVKTTAESLQNYADDMTRMRLIADNDAALDVVPAPALRNLSIELERDNEVLRYFALSQAPALNETLTPIALGGPTGVMSIVTADIFTSSPASHEAVVPFRKYFEAQTRADESRHAVSACKDHMRRLGCEHSTSPAQVTNCGYLEQAWSCYRNPAHHTHSALPPLIAVRECINNTLDSLKRGLPNSNVKGKQDAVVLAVLQNGSRRALPPEYPAAMARELTDLLSRLSQEGKRAAISRDATLALLSAATNWLNRFLGEIDEAKLRVK